MSEDVVPYNIYEQPPELPTEEEYRANFHEVYEARINAVDCVNKDTTQDDAYLSANANTEGLALKHFRRPFGKLTRTEQNMILKCVAGHRREFEERAKTLRTLNTLSAHERVSRMSDIADKLMNMADDTIADLASLDKDDKSELVMRNQRLQKSKAGRVNAKMKGIKRIQGIVKTNVEINSMIVKLEEKKGSVFIKEGDDNRQIVTTPESVKLAFEDICE